MTDQERTFLELLGFVYLQNARPDKAAVVLAALDALQPGQPKVLCALALAQVRSAKPKRALETLDRLAMAGGIDAAFHLLRAQALGALERREEAAAAMQTYVQMRSPATRPAA
jgi:predicted Zn-dependent protease